MRFGSGLEMFPVDAFTPRSDSRLAIPGLLPVSAIDYVSGCLMALGAMLALARRAREGGSWLVRVSLARTGQWILERGIVPPAALADTPPDWTRPPVPLGHHAPEWPA